MMKIKNKKTISFSSILIILPQHASIHMERVGKVEREMEHGVPTPAPNKIPGFAPVQAYIMQVDGRVSQRQDAELANTVRRSCI